METRHPVEGPFCREFPAICNHCGFMTAWSRNAWKFCEQFLRFLEKRSLSNWRYCADRAQNLPGPATHIWLTLFQISSKSIHFRRSLLLLPNAWRPFLPRRVFPNIPVIEMTFEGWLNATYCISLSESSAVGQRPLLLNSVNLSMSTASLR